MSTKYRVLLVPVAVLAAIVVALMIEPISFQVRETARTVVKMARDFMDPFQDWSIGLYEGPTPFDLSPAANVSNPILTARDVDDVAADIVADPFFVFDGNMYFLFFEILNSRKQQGDISYAVSEDGISWQYKKVIIDEEFHLSYPYVFEWDSDYYMVLESYQDQSVRLYKAMSFPDEWSYVGNLLSGAPFVDPSIFRHDDKWWLFVTTPNNSDLDLYFADSLTGEWQRHPMSPVIQNNPNIARPAGRVIIYDGKPYRFAQDDYPTYGLRVFAFAIDQLTETQYAESPVSTEAITGPTGGGWNGAGMHHVDVRKVGDRWLAVVDGRSR